MAQAALSVHRQRRPIIVLPGLFLYKQEQQAYENHVHGIQCTTADNMKADAPSCNFEVTKRLLQSQYGQLHMNTSEARALSFDIILGRMRDHLIHTRTKCSV